MIIKIVPVSEQRKHLCIVLFKRKAFLNVLLERFGRPLAESSRFLGIHAVADCDNGIEVIMLQVHCSKFNTGLYCFIAIIYSRSCTVFRTLDFAVFARTIGFDTLERFLDSRVLPSFFPLPRLHTELSLNLCNQDWGTVPIREPFEQL